MEPTSRISYVQSLASQQAPPPYFMPKVTVHGFIWDARIERIQDHCDQTFNLGTPEARGFVYRSAPAWPYVLMFCINYPIMVSCEPESRRAVKPRVRDAVAPDPGAKGHGRPFLDFAKRGYVSQREVFIAVPIMRSGVSPLAALTTTTLEWSLPFIVVENPMSAVCGREMLGLEKLLADIKFAPADLPESFKGTVELTGWGERTTPLPFLEVKTGQMLPSPRGTPHGSSVWSLLQSRGAREWIRGLSTATDFLESVSEGLAPTTMRTVALKQIRDALNPGRALYQAIVGCRTNYSNIDEFRFFHEQDVTIVFKKHARFAPILELALPPETHETESKFWFRPRAAFTFRADIDFDDMRTLHTFDVRQQSGDPVVEKVGDLTAPWARPWKGLFAREPKP